MSTNYIDARDSEATVTTTTSQEINRHATVTNPFNIIRRMTDSIIDPTDKDRFLEVLTLDDWVVLYRLSTAAAALGVTLPHELMMELSECGIYPFCNNIATRMSAQVYGDNAEFQHSHLVEYRFNISALLEQGIVKALTADIVGLTH
jgi:hypothetical protein